HPAAVVPHDQGSAGLRPLAQRVGDREPGRVFGDVHGDLPPLGGVLPPVRHRVLAAQVVVLGLFHVGAVGALRPPVQVLADRALGVGGVVDPHAEEVHLGGDRLRGGGGSVGGDRDRRVGVLPPGADQVVPVGLVGADRGDELGVPV